MHILHITPYYAPAWAYGGSVRVAYELATRTAAQGHTVTVLTTDALDATRRAAPGMHTIDGVTVHRLPNLSNALAWRRVFLPRGFRRAAAQFVPAADVVHVHEARSLLNAAALPALRRAGTPTIISPHGSLPAELGRTAYKRLYDALWGRAFLERACRLHALTEMEQRQFLALGLPADRTLRIPNGIDVTAADLPADVDAFKRRFDIPPGQPVVGFLGRLNTIKGLDFLVDAFALVLARRPDAVLLLAGPDDGARPALEAQVERLGLRRAVRFTGMLTADVDKAAAYRATNVYVLPSRYEILAITALEALLNATPSIVTDRCGLAGELQAAGIAEVVRFGDAPALAARIVAALAEPERAREQARRGQEYVRERFSWEVVTAQWLEAYRACLDAPREKR